MIYIYDDNKGEYFNAGFLESLYQKGVRAVVLNNFMPSQELVNLLMRFRIEPFISTKVHDDSFIEDIPKIKALGAKVALDCEAYSGSTIWSNFDQALKNSEKISQLLDWGTEVLIFPESLDPERYKYYRAFLDSFNKRVKLRLMLELTYQRWKPWQIISSWNDYKGFKRLLAIWPAKLPYICRIIQRFTIKCLSKDLFFYSENKTDWQKYL